MKRGKRPCVLQSYLPRASSVETSNIRSILQCKETHKPDQTRICVVLGIVSRVSYHAIYVTYERLGIGPR